MSEFVRMNGKKIASVATNCTGCGLCELACSFVKSGDFNPEQAYVVVDRLPDMQGFGIRFKSGCDACGYCWGVCKFDALHLVRESV
jgi:ferredoxin